jgi:hypothetical protein
VQAFRSHLCAQLRIVLGAAAARHGKNIMKPHRIAA